MPIILPNRNNLGVGFLFFNHHIDEIEGNKSSFYLNKSSYGMCGTSRENKQIYICVHISYAYVN